MSTLSRCSVLAAANPVYRRYNPYNTPRENIGLQDFLLSHFDGLFIMLDMINVDSDRKIADHVVRMHRYHSLQEQDYDYDNEDDCAGAGRTVNAIAADANVLTTRDLSEGGEGAGQDGNTPIYEKYDTLRQPAWQLL